MVHLQLFLMAVATLGCVSSHPMEDELLLPSVKSYSGYSVVRTAPIHGEEKVSSLMELDGRRGVHFWKYPLLNASSDILTSPNQLSHIQRLLDSLGVGHSILIPDVETLLQQEVSQHDAPSNFGKDAGSEEEDPSSKSTSTAFFQRYQSYDAIMNHARTLAAGDSRVTYESVGTSSEGREIGIVKISSGGNKPAIWIDGGMHAREWISPATATYILDKLVKDPSSKGLVDSFDWYIVPLINVDGYVYTQTGDRMWRKTRSRNNGRCIGVDPNRNWNYKWAYQGSSSDPCSDIYHGPNAFSEPETLAVARAIKARTNIKMYITLHAYSQLWLVPYGYARGARPSDYNELMRMAKVGANALYSTHRTSYRIGTAPDLLYPAAGGSDDWAKGAAGIKYSYCLELRDTGSYGFLLPANQIAPTGQETFNGVAAMAKDLLRSMGKGQQSSGPYVNADKEMNSPSGGAYPEDKDSAL